MPATSRAAVARLESAWTGGQYSIARALAGGGAAVALAVHGAQGHGPDAVLDLALAGLAAAVALGVGTAARTTTAVLLLLLPLSDALSGPLAATVAGWLSLHLFLPPAPWGSLAARGRVDPRGSWRMPRWYPLGCATMFFLDRLLAAAQAASQAEPRLAAVLLLLALLGLARRTAPAAWSASALLALAMAWQGNGSVPLALFFHLVTFQPAWAPGRRHAEASLVFHDGHCALCHAVVRTLLGEDRHGLLRFAPIGGEAWLRRFPKDQRTNLADSVLVVRGDEVLSKGHAVRDLLEQLGGLWWLPWLALRILPAVVVDAGYDVVAANRARWFGRKPSPCPLVPEALRMRMEA